MIVKKIRNKKSRSSKANRVAGVANYIVEPERENGLEKCIHHEAENFLTDTHEGHVAEMTALAQDAVRSKDPIDHWVLSWPPDERPTVEQAREAVKIFIQHCGLKGHQVIWGLHDDTENLHVHIAINRVHPETLKVVEINKGFQKEAAHQAIAIIEKKQGWRSVENARYRTDEKGDLLINSKTKRAQIFENPDKPLEPTGPAKDMEIQTGQKSAQRVGIENAAPIIAQATSWKELHAAMAEAGMQYQRKGSGAVVQVGDEFVKASSVTPKASLSALQKRFGPYQPPKEINPNEYHDTTRNFTAAKAQKQNPLEAGKSTGNGLRSLSKCTLAHSEKSKQASRPRVLQLDVSPDRRAVDGLRRTAGRAINTKLTPQPLRKNQAGWNEYIDIRDAQKAAKTHATVDQQKRHGEERAALAAKQKAERAVIFAGNWQGKGEAKNVLKSFVATQQAAEKLELSQQHQDERKALQAQYKPLPIYKEWKEQPQIVSLHVLPLVEQRIERDKQATVAQTLRALSHTVDARKHITYQLDRKNVFRDEGKTIAILDLNSDRGIAAALATAQQKYGQTLELTGSDAFKRKAVAVAVENNLTCKFTDPALDKLREQLQQEKYRAERERMERDRAAAEKQWKDSKEAEKKTPAPQPIQETREAVPPAPGHQNLDPVQAPKAQQPEELDVEGLVTDRERELVMRINEAIKTDNGPELQTCMDALGGVRNEAKKALVAVSPQEVNKAAIAHQVKQEQNEAARKRGDQEPWYMSGVGSKTGVCAWDRSAKEAAEERDAHAKTARPAGMFKGAETKAWDERSAQLKDLASSWEKAASSIKKELSTTTDQRVAKEAQTVAATNAKNAPQREKQAERTRAIERIEKRLEKALVPHRERQQERENSKGWGR